MYLSSAYNQCRAARDAQFQDKAIEIGTANSLGCTVGGEPPHIGSFEQEGETKNTCFLGSRVTKGARTANQSISLSFDPSTLTCICCPKEHTIFQGSNPVCVCVGDQNFAANLSGGEKCVSIIRVESSSLEELAELFQEIFGANKFPPGSVVCMGSASHLHRVGLTIYAADWIRCVATLDKTIDGIQVCPLVPILSHDIPGSLATDLIKLAIWYSDVYKGTTLGLIRTWVKLAQQLTTHTSTGSSDTEYHSVALPDSIHPNASLTAHRFLSTSSRRVTTSGFDGKATNELLCTLLTALHTDLGISCSPGPTPVREPQAKQGVKEEVTHVILVGASNMRRCATHLRELGHRVTECQLPGGMPNDSGMEHVEKFLKELDSGPGTVLVFDLFGNFSDRFEQSDGNMALPIWLGGKPHLLGRVGVCQDQNLKDLVAKLIPVLSTHGDIPKVILPAIPRYISGGCCQEPTHASNSQEEGHAVAMIAKVAHLRTVLRGELAGSSLTNYWVPNVLDHLAPSASGGSAADAEGHFELSSLFTGDNVHLTPLGYGRLAECIANGINEAVKRSLEQECEVTCEIRMHYWRGFSSRNGSSKPKHSQQMLKMRGRGGRGGGEGGERGGGKGGHFLFVLHFINK